MAKVRTIGKPLGPRTDRVLWMALQPMLADVRATLPLVKTAADVRALASALKRRYSDAKIKEIVRRSAAIVEKAASSPWVAVDAAVRRARAKGDRLDAKEFDATSLLDKWTRDVVSQITSIREEASARLRGDILRAIDEGADPATLAAGWIKSGLPLKFGTLEGRSKVIAQTAIAQLHENIRITRAKSLGITESIWRHSDQSVSQGARPEHVALDGTRYKNDEPPGGVRPGQLPNCRCWGESVIPDALVAGLNLGSIFER